LDQVSFLAVIFPAKIKKLVNFVVWRSSLAKTVT
jgi:hypothetical protein